MTIKTKNSVPVAVVGADVKICSAQDMLDLMATAMYESGCRCFVMRKESLADGFFDLKTGVAGEILQKFSNYGCRLAIVGDFSVYQSKSLRDFIYESNKTGRIIFKSSEDEALEGLTAGGSNAAFSLSEN